MLLRRLLPLVALAALLPVPDVHAQTAAVPVESAVAEVTVFRRGAQVTRRGAARVPAGTTALTFAGLTPALVPSSLQLRARGDLTVLSVVHRRDFLGPDAPAAAVAALEAERAAVRDSLDIAEAMQEVYAQEEALLDANRAIGGADGTAVAELRAAAAFFRERLAEIKRARLALADEAETLRARLSDLDRQLAELRGRPGDRATSVVEVTVAADAPVPADFELDYVTYAAEWQPVYDVRVDDVGAPVTVGYRADVAQETGEDWRDVHLTLSTGNPARPGALPELQPWRIGFAPERAAVREKAARVAMDEVVVTEGDEPLPLDASLDVDGRSPEVDQIVGLTTTRFAIAVPYAIPSDGKPHRVAVEAYEVPAVFAYYAAPRLDPSAFLTARVTDWAGLGLVPGPANLFLEGAFVGTSFLDPAAVGDTLVLSLGRDDGIVLERELVEDVSDRERLGTRETETFAYRITVRNAKTRGVELVVEDAAPVSTDDAIDVEVDVRDGGTLDEATGIARWRLVLPPETSETLGFGYTIRYPRGRRLSR